MLEEGLGELTRGAGGQAGGIPVVPKTSSPSGSESSRILKNSFSPRLLKKVQMQGGTRRAE